MKTWIPLLKQIAVGELRRSFVNFCMRYFARDQNFLMPYAVDSHVILAVCSMYLPSKNRENVEVAFVFC